ncbi:MAG: hypothetical protein ACRDFT_07710, partial [bacterium]
MNGGSGGGAVRRTVLQTLLPPAAVAVVLTAPPPDRLTAQTGFSASSAAAQREFETKLLAVPDTAHVRRMSRDLTGVPHVAGRPEQAITRDYVIERMRSWGLDTWSK